MLHDCRLIDLGLSDFDDAYSLQKEAVCFAKEKNVQTLFICEHPTVITLGRLAKRENILIDADNCPFPIVDIDRGGDTTLHNPGQLVMYTIFNLDNYGRDLKAFMQMLENAVLSSLNRLSIIGETRNNSVGVWVKDKKIASVGIGVKKWISFHGVSLNVSNDLNEYKFIRPCDMDIKMTSVESELKNPVNIEDIKSDIADCFSSVFKLNYINEEIRNECCCA